MQSALFAQGLTGGSPEIDENVQISKASHFTWYG